MIETPSLMPADVDECAVSHATEGALGPCVNAAACNNTLGGYSCVCLAGWTGRDCETNVDDCTGQCLNGATCIDLVDDFHCACAAGYAGRTCARDVDDCAPRPCRNGGECVDLLNAYRCICPVGFSGTNCEVSTTTAGSCSPPGPPAIISLMILLHIRTLTRLTPCLLLSFLPALEGTVG